MQSPTEMSDFRLTQEHQSKDANKSLVNERIAAENRAKWIAMLDFCGLGHKDLRNSHEALNPSNLCIYKTS
jgi:hypothetical protein